MRSLIEKPETQNRKLESTGLGKPCKTRRLIGMGSGLARQDAACRVFGRFWYRTEPFFRSEPGPLAGYPDPLLTPVWGVLKTGDVGWQKENTIGIQLLER